MVILHKITWNEFQRIIKILLGYKKIATKVNEKDVLWFGNILNTLSKVKKQGYNINIEELKKEDLSRITAIVDVWNVINEFIEEEGTISYEEDNKLSSKLQKAYFELFNECVFLED